MWHDEKTIRPIALSVERKFGMGGLVGGIYEDFASEVAKAYHEHMVRLRPESEWHEDMGDVLWYHCPVEEPPVVGSPLDVGWDNCSGWFTHFQLLHNHSGIFELNTKESQGD